VQYHFGMAGTPACVAACIVSVLIPGIVLGGCAPSGGGAQLRERPAPAPANRWLADNDDRDSDGDGLSDFQEIHKYFTDPARADSDGDGAADGDWHERRERAYSIRNVMELLEPVDLDAMNSDYQDARLVEKREKSVIVEVVHYPFNTIDQGIGENPNWRTEYQAMTRYLAPTRTANWDPALQAALLQELAKAGIEPGQLTDRQLVERVSAWVFRRFTSGAPFTGYFVEFTHPIALRSELAPRLYYDNPGLDPGGLQEALELGVFGRKMFAARKFGACTSSAILLTTILRALGIPTRLVLTVPAIDANDPAQWAQMRAGISNPGARRILEAGFARAVGWASHTHNEVFVGRRWVTLNYATLGRNSLDASSMGLMTRVNTMIDWSDVDLTSTWGLRFAGPDNSQLVPRLSSRHAYMSLGMSDRLGRQARASALGVPSGAP
jgi:hypothetical protein